MVFDELLYTDINYKNNTNYDKTSYQSKEKIFPLKYIKNYLPILLFSFNELINDNKEINNIADNDAI